MESIIGSLIISTVFVLGVYYITESGKNLFQF